MRGRRNTRWASNSFHAGPRRGFAELASKEVKIVFKNSLAARPGGRCFGQTATI